MSEAHNKNNNNLCTQIIFAGTDNRNDDDDDGDGVGVEEPYRATFRYRDLSSYVTEDRLPTPTGLHACTRQGLSVTVDEVFAKARSVFRLVCPGQNFLRLSEVTEDIVNEAKVGKTEEEDHDVVLLESAMDMVDSKLAAVEGVGGGD